MSLNQHDYLSVLSQTPADTIKPFTETMLERLGDITVILNRTGLVMAPYKDTVQGETFHLGEVLVSEARVKMGEHEGYGACMGRDLEQSMAIAILDVAIQSGQHVEEISTFIEHEAARQAKEEEELLKRVEATRVEMETFV